MRVLIYHDVSNRLIGELTLDNPLVDGDFVDVRSSESGEGYYRVVATHKLSEETQLVNVRTRAATVRGGF